MSWKPPPSFTGEVPSPRGKSPPRPSSPHSSSAKLSPRPVSPKPGLSPKPPSARSPLPPRAGSGKSPKGKTKIKASWAPAFVVADELVDNSEHAEGGFEPPVIGNGVSIDRSSFLKKQNPTRTLTPDAGSKNKLSTETSSMGELPPLAAVPPSRPGLVKTPPPSRTLSPPELEQMVGTGELKLPPRQDSELAPLAAIPTSRPALPPRSMTPPKSALRNHQAPSHSALKTSKAASSTAVADEKKTGVNWNTALFVVDQINSEDPASVPAKTAPKPPPRRGWGSLKRHVSRKETFIADQQVLDTRLEWTQQLVSEAFKPYRKMICDMDDDLPDAEDDMAFDQDDFLDEDHEMRDVRDEMLDDPKISEREIAAFFEGYKLFQIKANSLKAQLTAVKALQKMQARSQVLSSRQIQLSAASDRALGRNVALASERLISIKNRQMARGSMPPIADRSAMMKMAKSSISGDPSEIKPVAPVPVPVPAADKKEFTTDATPKPAEDAATKEKDASETPVETAKPDAAKPSAEADAEKKDNEKPDDKKAEKTSQNVEKKEEEKKEDKKEAPPKRGLMMSNSLRALSIKRIKETAPVEGNSDIHKLLEELEEAERRQKKLEKQLAQAGVVIAEDIPYDVAKAKVASIAQRMGEIGSSDVADKDLKEEYFKLEQDMEKYTAALMLTDEYQEEQEELERQWEASVEGDNQEAIKKVRRHMPVEVRNMSEAALATNPTPNGKRLPKDIAKKFKRTNVLQLLRIDPEEIVPMHPSTLENMRVTGMTLTERRAMYMHLKEVGPRWKAMQSDKMTERKWTWFSMMKSNFKENVEAWQRHVDQYGPPGNHPYATRENPNAGCPMIGKQCPLKADKLIDYDGDYGFPEGPEYFKTEVKKADGDNADEEKQKALEAAREQKSLERSGALKKHYKGKILQVSLASGSCENMDEAMDKIEAAQEKAIRKCLESKGKELDENSKKKEVSAFTESLNELKLSILQFAERSGMQLTGKRDANADQPDIRSMIELALCEEVIETSQDFFSGVEKRLAEINVKDGRMKSTITQLRELLDELHERNLNSMENLGGERPPRSRPRMDRDKLIQEIEKELEAKAAEERKAAEAAAEAEAAAAALARPPMPMGGGGRGDLLSALQGRGRGRGGGGRGDLMSAIAGRGRGGRGGGGRGDLMSAIAGRGRGGGGGGGGDDDGGRGGLMAAIAGRGRGRGGGGGGGGGRGDLMAAIAGRGRGGGGGGGDSGGGGRGDLMAAIAGRGRGGGGGPGRGGDGGRGGLMAAIAARGGGGN